MMNMMKKLHLTLLLFLSTLVVTLLPSQSQSVQLSKAALDTALSYEGTREVGKNRGKIIDKIVLYRGGSLGESYCMDYVFYCYGKSSEALKVPNPLYRTGSCAMQLKMANRINSKLQIIPVANNYFKVKALPGDVPIFKHDSFKKTDLNKLWAGHTCIVIAQHGDTLYTIEANTNLAGSYAGDGIWKNKRYMYSTKFPIVALLRKT